MAIDNADLERLKLLNLQQLSDLEYILLGDLRDVLEEESTEETRRWLTAIVEALLRTVPREFALRSRDGYLNSLLLECPEADSNVKRLEVEQTTLCEQLQELYDRLQGPGSFHAHAFELKRDLAGWMEQLQSHNLREERLFQDAYFQDTGGGD
ncbi:hypothetical protein [Rubinisphaera margarita]|uniref:hypothetical protein n=1 Tax=Rubinisphaera margarita TaxID=2909586 RepID=UPI001EE963C1|nr:hypothetical protein [Rubinisphaera margarita]MCG6157003.1 hypothetical protein [Rubinisphaera margarita]